ncbi:hypothetical protein C8R46DRAFT_1306486 [Mycena filopes]|nr:hypothetical protein C8R46DRAFT_1306486 [Mycena filopes]
MSSTSANTPHIPRPPNAFMIFRSQFIQDEREVLRLQGRSDTSRMQDISRAAGHQWRAMNGEARRPFFEQADEAKRMHGLRHPDYVFRPAKKAAKGEPHVQTAPRPSRTSRSRAQASGSQRQTGTPESASPSSSTSSRHPSLRSQPMPVLSSSWTPPPSNSPHGGPSLHLPADMSGGGQYGVYGLSSYNNDWAIPAPTARAPQDFMLSPYHSYPGVDSGASTPESWDTHTPRAHHGHGGFAPQPGFGELCKWEDDFSESSSGYPSAAPVSPYRPGEPPSGSSRSHYRPY